MNGLGRIVDACAPSDHHEGANFLRGMFFSLLPSAMMLFMVLPSMGKGMFGLGFGTMMPFVVVLLNFIYGIFASFWYSKVVS